MEGNIEGEMETEIETFAQTIHKLIRVYAKGAQKVPILSHNVHFKLYIKTYANKKYIYYENTCTII